MGKLIQKGTQALGLTADPNTGAGAMQQSSALQERAVRELEKLGVPSIEAQQIALQNPELVLSSLEEKLGPSAMEDVEVDPRLQQAEMDALLSMQEAGEKGFTAEDKARIEALRSQIGSDEKARQASILQQMAQRGALDSGAQLAAQLNSSQASTQRASEEGIQLAAQQAAARRNALSQAGQLASQMGSRQFAQQAQKAGASDAIKQFNASVAARDTAAKQQYAQQKANIANQQEMYNKGLIQQQYQNELAKATGISGALGNQAQGAMNQAQMQAQAAQQQAAGMRGLVMGGAQAVAMSDKRLKENIDSVDSSNDSEKLHEMFDKAQPFEYDYKDEKYGEGKQRGLMAQDLEKSEKGKDFVIDTPEGKAIDYGKMSSTLAAGVSDLHKRVKELEGKKYADGGRPQMMAGDGTSDVGSALNSQEEVAQANSEIENKDKKTASLKDILDAFSRGQEQGSAMISPAQVGNINPISVQAPQQSNQSLNSLQAIKQKLLAGQAMADGGTKGMNYQAGGEGTVIESLEDKPLKENLYTGDELPDRINEGEMVLNLDQQDTFNDLLKELGERRRADEKVQNGEAVINEPQQDTLMAVARKEAQPEDLADNGGSIVEDVEVSERPQVGQEEALPMDVNGIEDLLNAIKMSEEGYEFADGGQKIDSVSFINDSKRSAVEELIQEEKDNLGLNEYLTPGLVRRWNREDLTDVRLNQLIDSLNKEKLKDKPRNNLIEKLENKIIKNVERGYRSPVERKYFKEKQGYADGGIEDLLADIKTPYSDMMSREETPEEQALDLDNILASTQPEQNMSVGEPAELPNMSIGEPAQIPTIEQANKQVESANAPKEPKQEKKEVVKEQTDDELKSAQNKDMWLTLMGNVDKALAHFDAANPNAKLTPVQRDMIKANFEDKLLQARELAAQRKDKESLADYRDRQLDLQEKSMEGAAEERKLRREERKAEKEESRKQIDEKEARLLRKDQLNAARGLLKDDPRFKKAVEQGMEFESVDRLLAEAEKGNQAAVAALGTKLARAMGEVGVLTDTDVVRYVGGTSWGRKLKDWYVKGAEGELSSDTLKDIQKNLKMLKGKLKEDTGRVYSNAESRMRTAYPDLDDQTIQGLLGRPATSGQAESLKQPTNDQVKKYSSMHGVSEDQAKQILTQRLNR